MYYYTALYIQFDIQYISFYLQTYSIQVKQYRYSKSQLCDIKCNLFYRPALISQILQYSMKILRYYKDKHHGLCKVALKPCVL